MYYIKDIGGMIPRQTKGQKMRKAYGEFMGDTIKRMKMELETSKCEYEKEALKVAIEVFTEYLEG